MTSPELLATNSAKKLSKDLRQNCISVAGATNNHPNDQLSQVLSTDQLVPNASTSNAVVADTFYWAVFDSKMNNF